MVKHPQNLSSISKIKADTRLAALARQDHVEKTHLEAKIWLRLLSEKLEKNLAERATSLL